MSVTVKLAQALNEQSGVLITDYTYSSTTAWNHWYLVFRPSDSSIVARALTYAIQACNNNFIGYSQSTRRTTFYTEALKVSKNIPAINVQCWCDCSSFVSGIYNLAGANIPYNLTTRSMTPYFQKIGTSFSYNGDVSLLRAGDVLLADGHTAMVYSVTSPLEPVDGYYIDSEGFWHRAPYNYLGRDSEYAKSNALLLASLLREKGWSDWGIAGFYSAVSFESQFDSNLIEGLRETPLESTGVGLIQWTPSSDLISYANAWGVDWKLNTTQVRMLEYEREHNTQYYSTITRYRELWDETFSKEPPRRMDDYVTAQPSQWDALEMASAWILFYTRPGSYADKTRWERNAEWVTYWYNYISDNPQPVPPTPPKPERRTKLPLYFYLRRY